MIEALPDLKLLITTGMRNNSFDVAAANARGVTVCGTGAVGSPTTGIAFGLMLELTRRIGFENARLKSGANLAGDDRQGPRRPDARRHRPGQARPAFGGGRQGLRHEDNRLESESDAGKGEGGRADYASKEDLFRNADIITIHLVLSERSRGLIGAKELGLMKKSAYLVNTSRGPIVDEKALIAALSAKTIAGAGLDVFDAEPLPLDHPYRKMDNIVITPHLGYVSEQNYRKYFPDIVEDIRGFLDGKPVRVIAAK